VKRLVALVALLAGCHGAPPAEVDVYAASSLAEAFADLAPRFEAAHGGAKVVLNLAGSQALRTQIEGGAPADVFASADGDHVDALQGEGLVAGDAVFARNELVVVVPRGNPARVRTLADLANAPRVVLAAPDVPVGRYARRLLDAAGADFRARVEARVVSEETNVRMVLARVRMGEADAGVVYRTDARVAGDEVEIVEVPAALNVRGEYHAAVLKGAPHPDLARAWTDFLASPEARRVLADRGFTLPAADASPPPPAGGVAAGAAPSAAAARPAPPADGLATGDPRRTPPGP
jgi:molybdate transport system substrate-binding protein